MSVAIKRNDPCLCGSGKKYKKCCMNKEAIELSHQVKEERFYQQKQTLTDQLHTFIDERVFKDRSQTHILEAFKEGTRGMLPERIEPGYFRVWLYYFYRYENGLRGIEWFLQEKEDELTPDQKEILHRWTNIKPRIVEATEKTESSVQFPDLFTNEIFTVRYPTETLPEFTPWYGTVALFDPIDEYHYFHGINVLVSPEQLEKTIKKVEELKASRADAVESIVTEHYLQLLAEMFTPNATENTDEKKYKDVQLHKIKAMVLNEEKVADYFQQLDEFVLDEWKDGNKKASWVKNWSVYQDNEIEGDVQLAEVNGSLVIASGRLEYVCYDEQAAQNFIAKIKGIQLFLSDVKKEVETHQIPANSKLMNIMVHTVENAPPVASLYAQVVGLMDPNEAIAKYDDLSLRELVKIGRAKDADLWLKQTEYDVYRMAIHQYREVPFTADFNSIRRAIGLPLSPFVTGGESRISSILQTESEDEEEIVSADHTETNHDFYSEDLLTFYHEKTDGKGENTVKKYRTNVDYLQTALEDASYSSWSEVDTDFWMKVLFVNFYETNEKLTKTKLKDFLSTVKLFTKWLDKQKETSFAKDVATMISETEDELVAAIQLRNSFGTKTGTGNEDIYRVEEKDEEHISLKPVGKSEQAIICKPNEEDLSFVYEGMLIVAEIGTDHEISSVLTVYPSGAEKFI